MVLLNMKQIIKCKMQMQNEHHDIIDIPMTENDEDLGVILEKNLKFNQHALSVVHRTKKLPRLIKRFLNMFFTLYKALIGLLSITFKNVQLYIENTSMQRRATRLVTKIRGFSLY